MLFMVVVCCHVGYGHWVLAILRDVFIGIEFKEASVGFSKEVRTYVSIPLNSVHHQYKS